MTNKNEMQAIYITENGDVDVLKTQRCPKPIPKKGEALIKLKRAGLNVRAHKVEVATISVAPEIES